MSLTWEMIYNYGVSGHKIGLSMTAIRADVLEFVSGYDFTIHLQESKYVTVLQTPRLNYVAGSQTEKRFMDFSVEAGDEPPQMLPKYLQRGFPRDLASAASFVAQGFESYKVAAQYIMGSNERGSFDIDAFIPYARVLGFSRHEVIAKFLHRLPLHLRVSDAEYAAKLTGFPGEKFMDYNAEKFIKAAGAMGMPVKRIYKELRIHGYTMVVIEAVEAVLRTK